jgi:hypothetical protein
MRFTTHQVRTFKDLDAVYQVFDALDDRYLAGFDNYPSPGYTVVVAHGREWPQGVAVLVGNIITAFVVSADVSNRRASQVWDALIVQLQTMYGWLIFHDADIAEFGQEQGFVEVAPPDGTEDPVIIVTWGDLPAPLTTIMALQGLAWERDQHRGGRKVRERNN